MTDTWREREEERNMQSEELNIQNSPCTQEEDWSVSIPLKREKLLSLFKSDCSSQEKKNKKKTHRIVEDMDIGISNATVGPTLAEKPYPIKQTINTT